MGEHFLNAEKFRKSYSELLIDLALSICENNIFEFGDIGVSLILEREDIEKLPGFNDIENSLVGAILDFSRIAQKDDYF